MGGIVDRSVQKSRTLDCAYVHNIKAQRLPIKEHASSNLSHILNIDTVVNIVCTYITTKNWKETFDLCIPFRKKIIGGKIQRRKLLENGIFVNSESCLDTDIDKNNENNNHINESSNSNGNDNGDSDNENDNDNDNDNGNNDNDNDNDNNKES